MRKTGLLLIFILFLYGCPPRDEWADVEWGIYLTNNSKDTVVFYANIEKENSIYFFSDKWPDKFDDQFFLEVSPNKKKMLGYRPARDIKHTKGDSLMIIVFSKDTLEKYNFDAKILGEDNNYLKIGKGVQGMSYP